MKNAEIMCYWVASSLGVASRFYANYQSCIEELFENSGDIRYLSITEEQKQKLMARVNLDMLREEVFDLEKKKIYISTVESENYPEGLKNTYTPPTVLYYKGSMPGFEQAISVVGSRRCTRTGYSNIMNICEELSNNNVNVVSGMALGIDSAAHLGALKGTAPTAAVLGCGVDVIYPKSSYKLYEQIEDQGVVISEFAPGFQPYKTNFPIRNRIIAGISPGVVVADAPLKSGSHITVRMAYEENRDIFALPCDISYPQSELPNSLIDDGAQIVLGARTILEYYHWEQQKQKNLKNNDIVLDFYELGIYNLLKQGDFSIDEIAQQVDIDISKLNSSLTIMEIKGLIVKLPGKRFGIKR